MPRPVTALVVDDEPHVIVFLRGLLKQLDLKTVWEALDGDDALAKAAAHNPDMVLLDLNLPNLDGLQVLAKLKAAHPKLPVVVVTAQGTLKTYERARELGAEGYLLKYAPKSEILKMLSDILDGIAGADASKDAEKPAAASYPPRLERRTGRVGSGCADRADIERPEEILPCPRHSEGIGCSPWKRRGA